MYGGVPALNNSSCCAVNVSVWCTGEACVLYLFTEGKLRLSFHILSLNPELGDLHWGGFCAV